jgi:hypothetical protein
MAATSALTHFFGDFKVTADNGTDLLSISQGQVSMPTLVLDSIAFGDGEVAKFGNGDDFQIQFDGTNALLTSTQGDVVVANNFATGKIVTKLGTTDADTSFEVQGSGGAAQLSVAGDGTTTIAGGYGSTGVTVSAAGNVSAAGTITVDGASTLKGSVAIGGGYGDIVDGGTSISATGNIETNGTLTVDSTSTLTGTVTVGSGYGTSGATLTASNGNVATKGTLTVDSTSTLTGTVTVGSGYGTSGATLTASNGNVATKGTLTVDGTSLLGGLVTADAGLTTDTFAKLGRQTAADYARNVRFVAVNSGRTMTATERLDVIGSSGTQIAMSVKDSAIVNVRVMMVSAATENHASKRLQSTVRFSAWSENTATQEITDVQLVTGNTKGNLVSGGTGRYVLFYTAGGAKFAFWFNVSGSHAAPVVADATLVEVDISGAGITTDAHIASALQAVVDAQPEFGASVVTDTVTVTHRTAGDATNASSDAGANIALNVTTPGAGGYHFSGVSTTDQFAVGAPFATAGGTPGTWSVMHDGTNVKLLYAPPAGVTQVTDILSVADVDFTILSHGSAAY